MAPLWLHQASMEQPADNNDDFLRYAVGVRELRYNLSPFLAEVKEGKSVVVLDGSHLGHQTLAPPRPARGADPAGQGAASAELHPPAP